MLFTSPTGKLNGRYLRYHVETYGLSDIQGAQFALTFNQEQTACLAQKQNDPKLLARQHCLNLASSVEPQELGSRIFIDHAVFHMVPPANRMLLLLDTEGNDSLLDCGAHKENGKDLRKGPQRGKGCYGILATNDNVARKQILAQSRAILKYTTYTMHQTA